MTNKPREFLYDMTNMTACATTIALNLLITSGEDREMASEDAKNLRKMAHGVKVCFLLWVTRRFVEYLVMRFPELKSKQQEIFQSLSASPSANGYAIEYKDKEGKVSFIAEIRSESPYLNEGRAFDDEQKTKITDDLRGLRKGKPKSKLGLKDGNSLKGYHRFFGMFDGNKEETKKAMKRLCKTITGDADYGRIEFLDKKAQLKDLDKNTIYIVLFDNVRLDNKPTCKSGKAAPADI